MEQVEVTAVQVRSATGDTKTGQGAVGVRRYAIRYPSPWDAFREGDFHYAATHAGEDAVLKGAALIMLGHDEAGLPLLEGKDDLCALYARAVALWDEGLNQEALGCLGTCLKRVDERGSGTICRNDPKGAARKWFLTPSEWAERLRGLRGLIDRGPLRVLVQAPNNPMPSSSAYVDQMKRTSCEVVSLGFQESDDLQLEPYEPLSLVLARLPKGFLPDFYHGFGVDCDLMPVGLEQAPFPTTGFATDYDARVSTCYPHARLLDAMMVAGSVDHIEMTKGFGLPAFVFPKVGCVHPELFGAVDEPKKDIDVFISGTSISVYQSDKSTLIYRLRQLSDRARVKVVMKAPFREYCRAISRSRMTFSFIRRQPLWSSATRVPEALAGGTVVLVQEGSGAELFFSEDEGVVPYTEENLEQVVLRVLAGWEEVYGPAARRGREKARRIFDPRRCMEQYLKRAAILGAAASPACGEPSRTAGRRADSLASHLWYPPHVRGVLIASESRKAGVYAAVHRRTLERLGDVPERERDASWYNLLARSHVVTAHRSGAGDEASRCLKEAVAILLQGRRRFPNDLVLGFNYGRVCYDGGVIEQAYEAFGEVAAEDRKESWEVDPLADVYGDDYFPKYFHFRAYTDAAMRHLVTGEPQWLERLAVLIRSSAWCYRGLIEHERGQEEAASHSLKRGLRCCPDYHVHHLLYATILEALYKQAPAREILEAWAACFQEAHRLAPYETFGLLNLIQTMAALGRVREALSYCEEYDRLLKSTADRLRENDRIYLKVRAQLLGELKARRGKKEGGGRGEGARDRQ